MPNNWKFDEYRLNLDKDSAVTKINLPYAAHGVGTARDAEFHKLRRSLFRNDRIMFLIENKGNLQNNVFILLSKNMKMIRKSTVCLRLLWAIYDFIVKAYTTFVLDIFSFISSLIAIYRLDIKKQT